MLYHSTCINPKTDEFLKWKNPPSNSGLSIIIFRDIKMRTFNSIEAGQTAQIQMHYDLKKLKERGSTFIFQIFFILLSLQLNLPSICLSSI